MKFLIILFYTTSIFVDDSISLTTATKAPTNVCSNSHEIYSECGANGCQSTCESPLLSTYCKGTCITGCVCEDGYIRDASKKCVLPENCPSNIAETTTTISSVCTKSHEVYTDCGSLCAKTCKNKDEIVMCPALCVSGCFCEAGYVRDDNGDCILPEQCSAIPTCAKAHETYTDCGSACPLTCDNKDSELICTMQCVAGCFCEAGYVRDASGECVLAKECPKKKCSKNEKYITKTIVCSEATCTKEEKYCKLDKQAKCLCIEGYVRDEKNKCIKKSNCPV